MRLTEPFRPTPEDLAEYAAWSEEIDRQEAIRAERRETDQDDVDATWHVAGEAACPFNHGDH